MAKDKGGHGSEARGGYSGSKVEQSLAKPTMSAAFAAQGAFRPGVQPMTPEQQKTLLGRETPLGSHSTGVAQVGKQPTMTRQHFQMLADEFAKSPTRQSDPMGHARQVNSMADRLAGTNPRFNRAKFTAASGVNK